MPRFIRLRLALLAEPIRPNCKLDADPIADGGVRDPEARPKGLCDARGLTENKNKYSFFVRGKNIRKNWRWSILSYSKGK